MTLKDLVYKAKDLSEKDMIAEMESILKKYGQYKKRIGETPGHYESEDRYLDQFHQFVSKFPPGEHTEGENRARYFNAMVDALGGSNKFNYLDIEPPEGLYADKHIDERWIYDVDLSIGNVKPGYKYNAVYKTNGVQEYDEHTIKGDNKEDVQSKYYVKADDGPENNYVEVDTKDFIDNYINLPRKYGLITYDEYQKSLKDAKVKTFEQIYKQGDTQDGTESHNGGLISAIPMRETIGEKDVKSDKSKIKEPDIQRGLISTKAITKPSLKHTSQNKNITVNPVIPSDRKSEQPVMLPEVSVVGKPTQTNQPVMLPEVGIVAKYAPETSFNIARRIGEDAISNGALKSSVKPQSSDVVEPANVQKPVDTKVQAEPLIMSPDGVMPGAVASRGGLINSNVVSSNQSNSSVGTQIPAAVASRFNVQQSTPPNQPVMLPGATVTATKESPITMLPEVTVTPSTTEQSLSIARRVAEQALPKMNLAGSKEKPPKIVESQDPIDRATKAANTINLVNAGVGLATGIYGMNQVNKMKAPMPLTAPTITAEKVRDRGAQLAAASSGNINSQMSAVRNSLYRSGRQELLPSTIAPGVNAMNQASASIEQMRTDIDKINTAAENRVNEVNAANKYQIGSFNQQVGLSFQQMKSSLSNQVLSSAGQNISANLNGIVQNKFGSAMYQQGTLQRQREMYQQMLLSSDPETKMYAKRELDKLKANGTV